MQFQPFITLKNFLNSRATILSLLALTTLAAINGFAGASRNEATSQTAQPASSRVAVVDVQKILASSNVGKATYEKLKKMQEDRILKAKLMDEEVRKLDTQLVANKSVLSAAQISDLQKQIADKRTAMQRFIKDADGEISEARDRELQALNTKITPLIDALGKEMGINAIFNKFESGLIYASDSIDITDTVIKRMNEKLVVQ
jgi:outer membrane protein